MKTIQIIKGNQISAGNFIVSIGTFNSTDVAIYNKKQTRGFSKIASCKRSKKLTSIKKQFKVFLNNDTTFNFQFMQPDDARKIIAILRKK